MITRTEVLGLLFHGRVFQIYKRHQGFHELWEAQKKLKENPFGAEAAYKNWRRAEQRLLYGRTLTKEQYEYVAELPEQPGISREDIVKIMYGRMVTKDGSLLFRKWPQTSLAFLALFNAGVSFLWILLTSLALITQSDAGWLTIVSAIAATILIPGLPALYLMYCGIAPLRAYQRITRALKSGSIS